MNEKPKFELIVTNVIGPFDSAQEAAVHAARFYPRFKEDPDRAGNTWDVQECVLKA